MAYLGQRTFASFEKKTRGWGDFFEEDEEIYGDFFSNEKKKNDEELSNNEFMFREEKRTMRREGDHLYLSPFTEEDAEPFGEDSINTNGYPVVTYKDKVQSFSSVMLVIMNPEPGESFTAHYINSEDIEVQLVIHTKPQRFPAKDKETENNTEEKEKNVSKIDSSPKDDARIVYEKSDNNKHQFNNTGYIFRRGNGDPITDASEVRKFIKQQKQSDDPEISKQFKEDFPVAQKGTSKGFNAPTFEIEGYRYKYYSMLGDPNWGKEESEPVTDKPTADTDFIGSYVNNKPAKVNVPNGIILHDTPDVNDPLYNQIKRSDFKDDFLLKKGSKLEIIAKSNKDNPGWVMVRDENNRVGWIEERYLTEMEPTDVLAQYTGSWHQVKKGEGVAEILINEIPAKDQAGADMRNFALAFNILNANNPGIYSADHSWYVQGYRPIVDPSINEAIKNYKNIEVQEGIWVRIPTRAFLEKAKADGLIKTASPEAEMFIDFGRYGVAFLDGIYDGFVTSAQDFAEGIWELIESIFTGEILEQFKQMWEAIQEMVSDPSKIVEAFSGLIDDFEKKWNNPNELEAWHFRGEVTGQILFEIVMALIGIGAASLVNKLKQIGKLGKMITSMESKISKVKNKMTPKLPTKRPPTNKKGDLIYSPVKDSDETIKEAFDRKKKDFLDDFDNNFRKSDEFKDLWKTAHKKYNGNLNEVEYEKRYATLYKNRKTGKIGEENFELFKGGQAKTYDVIYESADGSIQETTRKIDNFADGTAREIKTGPLKNNKFTKDQILKDIEILKNNPQLEIEWHLFSDQKNNEALINMLKDNGIKVIEY